MIYEIKVEYTYRGGAFYPGPLTHSIETKKFFTGEKTYNRVVEYVEKYGKKDNNRKFGIKVYLCNGMYAPPLKVSDNYVFSDENTFDSSVDTLFGQIENEIFSPIKVSFWLTKWTVLSVLLFAALFSFKMCKMEWDEEVNPYNSRNWKGGDYYYQEAVGKQLEKDLEKIDKGEKPYGELRYNRDTCKQDLSWRNIPKGKKARREFFMKRILMDQPDLYTDKNGRRLQFPDAERRYHGYIEAKIEQDTLSLYGLDCLNSFTKDINYDDFDSYISEHAREYVDCGFKLIKGTTESKIYGYPAKRFIVKVINENGGWGLYSRHYEYDEVFHKNVIEKWYKVRHVVRKNN